MTINKTKINIKITTHIFESKINITFNYNLVAF